VQNVRMRAPGGDEINEPPRRNASNLRPLTLHCGSVHVEQLELEMNCIQDTANGPTGFSQVTPTRPCESGDITTMGIGILDPSIGSIECPR